MYVYLAHLLISEYKQWHSSHLVVLEQTMELIHSLSQTIAISAVDNIDQSVRLFKVILPERANRFLSADIPHRQLYVCVLGSLDIEALRAETRLICIACIT